ncbi:MAG: hypothetical protein IPK82_15930 [Polyangiaceae bacterium]|nr:hypothetical protein [Polyangiaceae bacterium]
MHRGTAEALAVVASPEGLYVPALDLHLDPVKPVKRAFISHAHGDHVASQTSATTLATTETAALVAARFGGIISNPAAFLEDIAWNAPIGPTVLRMVPAGHVLGAAQLIAETPAGRFVYTGDYQSGPGLTHAAGSPHECDVLVIEATFGLPIFHFPPRDSVQTTVVGWCTARLAEGLIPVLLCHALGKAQELIFALASANVPIAAHGSVRKVCDAYRSLGVHMPNVLPVAALEDGPAVLVVPPWARHQPFIKKRKDARIGFVSGWARIDAARERFDADELFVLSDHADFDDLMFTVRSSGARRVYTAFGQAAPFAALLREQGMDARPLEAVPRDLRESERMEPNA